MSNKHNRTRSGKEQPNDKANPFKLCKSNSKLLLVKNEESMLLKRNIENFFEEHKDFLHLKPSSKKHISIFLASVPCIFAKSNTHFGIQAGFVRTGIIDESAKLCLDY